MHLVVTRTRLKHMPADLQKRLANWGYAITEAAVRAHVASGTPPDTRFPV
jgi:NTE family protein